LIPSNSIPSIRQSPGTADAGLILPGLPSGARILLVRLRSIGDIVLLTPALRMLKAWRSDLRVSVVVEARFDELLEDNPDVDEILSPGEGAGWGKLFARARAVREIRKRRFAVCVNLHGGPTSTLLARWSGAACKVGFHHYRSRGTYDFLVPDAKVMLGQASVHTAELQAAALFYLGLPRGPVPRARLFVKPEHARWWAERREEMGIAAAQQYAILHPAALYASKQWPAERFAQLGAWLESAMRLSPVFVCGPGEQAVLDAIEQAAAARIRRLERASLGQLAAVLAGARLFVGNDSGPAHMAAALEKPVAVIFGSSSSGIWGPWTGSTEKHPTPQEAESIPARVVQNFYPCNPCPGDRCYKFERPECILSISVAQVQSAVEDVLRASRTSAEPASEGAPPRS